MTLISRFVLEYKASNVVWFPNKC